MAKKPDILTVLNELTDKVLKLEVEVRKLKIKQKELENKPIGGFMQYLSPQDMGYNEDPQFKKED